MKITTAKRIISKETLETLSKEEMDVILDEMRASIGYSEGDNVKESISSVFYSDYIHIRITKYEEEQ